VSAAYGIGAASYEEAAGEAGIARVVDAFYDYMDTLDQARTIRAMHPADLALSRAKLKAFLCAWLGGPNQYREKFGPISIPGAHARFTIASRARRVAQACAARWQPAVDRVQAVLHARDRGACRARASRLGPPSRGRLSAETDAVAAADAVTATCRVYSRDDAVPMPMTLPAQQRNSQPRST
jgi:hemoglobin